MHSKIIILVFLASYLISWLTFPALKTTSSPLALSSVVPFTPSPSPKPVPIPSSHILTGGNHSYQTFNNCGPAALSMILSYLDIDVSQQELGLILRPYQNRDGNNDDKSVTLAELAKQGETYGLTAYHRPAGNIAILQRFIAAGIPVITRTITKPNEDIGHFRVVKGYDRDRQILVQDDSLQGKDLEFTNLGFLDLWSKFNYEFLVLIPEDKKEATASILGSLRDRQTAWTESAAISRQVLENNPDDIFARFNLSVALYHLSDFEGSIVEYEKVAQLLPFRTLWYQTEPLLAYFELGQYEPVMDITNRIFNDGNRAYSELYLLRGQIFDLQGKSTDADQEYNLAVKYNSNFKSKFPR